ncbi:Fluoroacetate dehalogenase [Thalassocella blandensis]|nr:Fluoroacetate dehalogenase [Thalassocella blandensis]
MSIDENSSSLVNVDIKAYYEVQGQGEPLVLVHGSFASHATWKKMIDALQTRYQCVAIKLPGHGGVPDPEDFDQPTIATELTLLKRVIQDVWGDAQTPVHLAGHSFGGVVALILAVTEKLNVKSLTLFEPVAGGVFKLVNDEPMQAEMQTFLQRYLRSADAQEVDTCSLVIDFWGGDGSYAVLPESVKAAMRHLVQNNLRHWALCREPQYSLTQLQHFSAPTMLVNGTQSNRMAHQICHHLQHYMPNATLREIEGASHFMVNTHVQSSVEILLENLAKSQ